ncbi:MAG: ABC transporter permease [Desulfatirhabdiaceae bacterium]|nr:ABC transporter permease [Desulfatirhabdiaceae bacterium]
MMIGGVLVLVFVSLALFAPWLSRFDPLAIDPVNRLQPPSYGHWMGTDDLGRDIYSRVVFGSRISIQIGFWVVFLSTALGILVGLTAGYFKKVDAVVMRILDGLMAFPDIIIAVTLAAVWGSGKYTLVLAMVTAYFPRMTRTVRAAAINVCDLEYVESAKAIGCTSLYIIRKYILPNSLSPIVVQAAFIFAAAVLSEAALSFLGVGIKPPTPSWGGMVSQGRTYILIAPWVIVFPGIAIATVVLGLNLLGDGLRDHMDPRLKR